MQWNLAILFFAACFVDIGFTRLTPDYIHPCAIDNNDCLKKSSQDAIPDFVKGLPELGVPSLDPFHVDKISIPLPGIKVSFYNGRVTGFRKAIIENVESQYKKNKFIMEFRSNITLKGQYEATGRILTFPINGEGDVKIRTNNLRMKIIFNTHLVKDDKGVEHFAVKNYKHNFEFGDRTVYNMTNLFKGNPELSNTVLQFMNDNWRLIADEFGKPVIDYATELSVRTIEKFFLAVPYDELVHVPISTK